MPVLAASRRVCDGLRCLWCGCLLIARAGCAWLGLGPSAGLGSAAAAKSESCYASRVHAVRHRPRCGVLREATDAIG